MNDIENDIREAFASVRAATVIPPVPTHLRVVPAPRRKARRRAAIVLGLGIGLSSLGLGVAAAGKHFNIWWGEPTPGAFNAIPETERLIVKSTDATGKSVELWFADAVGEREAGYCVAFVLPDQVRPGGRPGDGGGCSGDVGTPLWDTFGGSGVTSGNSQVTLFAYRTGDATRVVLKSGKARHDLGVADGWTVGRINGAATGAVLIGYDEDGTEVGRRDVWPSRS